MAKSATILRWIVLTICVPLMLTLLQKIWGGVLDREHVADTPWEWVMGWLNWFANLPGIFPSSLIATGLVVGVWADWLLRKFDGSRAADRRTLGIRFCNLANSIEDRFRYDDKWPTNIIFLMPNITSAFIEAKKYGVWTPSEKLYEDSKGGNLMVYYLLHVGTPLRDGHFREAKEHSLQTKALASQSTTPAISP
jgi:hypothetical protein